MILPPEQFNIASYFIDRNLQLGRGGNVAVREEGRKLTYAQMAEMVNRAGNAFRSMGIEAENRILLALPDSAEFIAAFYGAAKIGAVPVPVNPVSSPDDYLYFLNDSGAQAFVLDEELWPLVQEKLAGAPCLRNVLLVRSAILPKAATPPPPVAGSANHYRVEPFAPWMQKASTSLDAEPTSRDDVAFLLYTSGSTGGPKGAVHLQHDMLVAAESYARSVLQITEQDICFSASKLYFAYGLGNSSYFPFSVGAAAVYLPQRTKPETVFDCIERFRPTLFFGVPTLFAAMLQPEQSREQPRDLSSIRLAVSAGEALPADIFHRFRERFGVTILDGIGSTEMLHIFISNRPGEIRPGASGKVVPGYEAKIVDDAGNSVPVGEIGNLWVKGESAAAFYWRKHERSKSTMTGEWMVTGDKYCVDHEGYYTYCGRADDMLKVSGRWVSPVEVENTIAGFPGVVEAAVVGQKDQDGLVKPKAFVVLSNSSAGVTEESLGNFLREKLPVYQCPCWIEFVPDLPKTPTGKIQRFKLREGLI